MLDEPFEKFIVLQEVTSAILASRDSENRTLSQPAFLKKPKKTIDKLEFFCKFIDVDTSDCAFLGLEEGSAYGSHESPMGIDKVFFHQCPSGESCNLNLGRKE